MLLTNQCTQHVIGVFGVTDFDFSTREGEIFPVGKELIISQLELSVGKELIMGYLSVEKALKMGHLSAENDNDNIEPPFSGGKELIMSHLSVGKELMNEPPINLNSYFVLFTNLSRKLW